MLYTLYTYVIKFYNAYRRIYLILLFNSIITTSQIRLNFLVLLYEAVHNFVRALRHGNFLSQNGNKCQTQTGNDDYVIYLDLG